MGVRPRSACAVMWANFSFNRSFNVSFLPREACFAQHGCQSKHAALASFARAHVLPDTMQCVTKGIFPMSQIFFPVVFNIGAQVLFIFNAKLNFTASIVNKIFMLKFKDDRSFS